MVQRDVQEIVKTDNKLRVEGVKNTEKENGEQINGQNKIKKERWQMNQDGEKRRGEKNMGTSKTTKIKKNKHLIQTYFLYYTFQRLAYN